MKKKLIFCAAAFAAIATVTSCSSDEPLLEAQQVLETEEPVVDPNDTGIPFTINATVENGQSTRAKDATSLTNFQLYAVNGTNNWISGTTFTKGDNWTGAWGDSGQPNWPTGTSTFYGISNNTATAPTITGTITSGSFTYTLPTDVNNGQEDLMAAKATGDATSGVNLSFKHILGAVTGLNFKLNCLLTGVADAEGTYLLIVKDIAFCNLVTKGTYAYETSKWSTEGLANNDAWESLEDKGTITALLSDQEFHYLVPDDTPETATTEGYTAANYTASWAVTLADNIYLLPQDNISAWDPGMATGIYFPNNPTDESEPGAYLKIKCVFAWADEDFESDGDDAYVQPYISNDEPDNYADFKTDEGAYIYVPFAATSIGANKGYKLNINLIKAFTIDGSGKVIPIIATADMNA